MLAQANPKVLDSIETNIWGIMAHQAYDYADRILPLLRTVVTPETGHTPGTVLEDIAQGRIGLWVIDDFKAITCTEFQHRTTELVLWNVWLAGSDMDDWVGDWLKVQEAFARQGGATAIEFAGRKGYARKYMPHFNQFKEIRTVYRHDL